MNRWLVVIVSAIAGFCACTGIYAADELVVAPCFGNNMVLQRDMKVPIWGAAKPITIVTASFSGQSKNVLAATNGRWKIVFGPMIADAGGKMLILISESGQSIRMTNVVVGDVWLCSGQSNMAQPIERVNNATQEIASAMYPDIRLNREKSGWAVCSPESIKGFSATAYFFGRDLHKSQNVPVGLIARSVGWTPIEYWIPQADLLKIAYAKKTHKKYNDLKLLAKDAELKKKYEKEMGEWKKERDAGNTDSKQPRRQRPKLGWRYGWKFGWKFDAAKFEIYSGDKPGNLFRRLIQPLVGYGIRGVAWYQGERNAHDIENSRLYEQYLPVLIESWRKRWDQGAFPFIYVQLPNFKEESWPYMRESMLRSLKVTNTGMVVTIDIGEAEKLHPKNKQDVGKRLALCARQKFYGEKINGQSPLFSSMKVKGTVAVLSFRNTGLGLIAKGGKLKGFTIAGADKRFVPAEAMVKGDAVFVMSPQVNRPMAVRYSWEANPVCTLYNKDGLPASPFRTDDW